MITTVSLSSRPKFISSDIEYTCVCGERERIHLFANESKTRICSNCKTELNIESNPKIRKTSRQINKELGYDTSND